jgi:hypothetical protein
MDNFQAICGCCITEVTLFNQGCFESPARAFTRRGGAMNASADNQHIEGFVLQINRISSHRSSF